MSKMTFHNVNIGERLLNFRKKMPQEDFLLSEIKTRIHQNFDVHFLKIVDESHKHKGHAQAKGGRHFRLTLICNDFEGLSRLQRHMRVMKIFADQIPYPIHALSLHLKSVGEERGEK